MKITSYCLCVFYSFLFPISYSLAAEAESKQPSAQFFRTDTKDTEKAPTEYFTGVVSLSRFSQPKSPSRLASALVIFQPTARSAWHSHPLGQLLIVTDGKGLIQEWGRPAKKIVAGDVIWTPPGTKHWHGGSESSGMSHVSAVENDAGKQVEWMEKVSDTQYRAASEETK